MTDLPADMRMKCVMVTEDGGKTWRIERIDYLVEQYKKNKFLESGEFEGITLKVVEPGMKEEEAIAKGYPSLEKVGKFFRERKAGGLPFKMVDIRKQVWTARKLGTSLEEVSKASGVPVEDLKLIEKLIPDAAVEKWVKEGGG